VISCKTTVSRFERRGTGTINGKQPEL